MKQTKTQKALYISFLGLMTILGFLAGIIYTQHNFERGLVEIVSKIPANAINIEFNETLMAQSIYNLLNQSGELNYENRSTNNQV